MWEIKSLWGERSLGKSLLIALKHPQRQLVPAFNDNVAGKAQAHQVDNQGNGYLH